MDIEYIDVEFTKKIRLSKAFLELLPKRIVLFTTAQFMGQLEDIKKEIEASGKEVVLLKAMHTGKAGQLLGCSIEDFSKKAKFDAFCYVGDGLFHPTALLLKNKMDVFVFNPFSGKHLALPKEDAKATAKKRSAALAGFRKAKRVGVLVSTKPGQSRMKEAFGLEKRFPDKEFTILVADTFNFQSLEDFNFIEAFVNTACPRIAYDDAGKLTKPIVDIEEIRD